MSSMFATHSSWCSVPERAWVTFRRWPSGCTSAGPSTAAAAPDPRVREANWLLKSARVEPLAFSRSIVPRWTCSTSSAPTIRAYLIWPESIMPAAIVMALTKPRQALVMSKFMHAGGRPRLWWIPVETAGSRCLRETEALISRPTWSRMIPALAIARSAASTTPCFQPFSRSRHHLRS